MYREWRKILSALDINMFPLVSTEFCATLYVLPYISHCFALVFWRNVLYYLSIRHFNLLVV